MRAFAYCAKRFEETTRKVAGVTPFTSPPIDALCFDPKWLEGQRFLYFDLHGVPGRPHWLGEAVLVPGLAAGRTVALTAETVRRADLTGAVVFAASCYLADHDSPMLDALLDAGAEYVIGGPGVNFAGHVEVFGAALLGLWVRRGLQWGMHPLAALAMAKARVRVHRATAGTLYSLAAQDALQFRAFYRR